MPKASPTHVVVHRIELQKGLNEELKNYIEARTNEKKVDNVITIAKWGGGAYVAYTAVCFVAELWSVTLQKINDVAEDIGETIDDIKDAPSEVVQTYVTGPKVIETETSEGLVVPVINPLHRVPVFGPVYAWGLKRTVGRLL